LTRRSSAKNSSIELIVVYKCLLPLSAFSIFGAKPPSSPTLVASRPYSVLILEEITNLTKKQIG